MKMTIDIFHNKLVRIPKDIETVEKGSRADVLIRNRKWEIKEGTRIVIKYKN